jgi:hypothetical protein
MAKLTVLCGSTLYSTREEFTLFRGFGSLTSCGAVIIVAREVRYGSLYFLDLKKGGDLQWEAI